MRPDETLRQFFARTDVRATLVVAAFLLLAVSLQGVLLYAFVAMETLEEADRWVELNLELLTAPIEAGESLDSAAHDVLAASPVQLASAAQLRNEHGAILESWGEWPAPDRQLPSSPGEDQRGLGAWRLLVAGNQLIGDTALSSGGVLEVAVPVDHFAQESMEVARGIALAALLSGILGALIAAVATVRAFAPLRRATALLRDVDARNLGRRLPTRSTRDPVDEHAETLNRVLARIDSAFARLRAFSSDAAHELRTPLNRMINVSEVALLGDREDEIRAALHSINETTEHLSRVVQSLLLLAELDDDRFELKRERIQVCEWVARTAEIFGPIFEEKGIKLDVDCDAGAIEGDSHLLDRLLANLLENAFRYSPEGALVEVHASRADGRVQIRVDDAGPGVPREEREWIFERFARADRTGDGAGVGLALARAIARAHGGDVTVDSSPLLGGARFILYLPHAT